MKPCGEELLRGGLAHAGYCEMVLLAGEGLDSVFIDGTDFGKRDLDAASGVFSAMKNETSGVEGELAGTATEVFLVPSGVDDGSEWNPR